MNRGDNPDRAKLNDLADWAAKEFQWNTQALIILTQLYWEPMEMVRSSASSSSSSFFFNTD